MMNNNTQHNFASLRHWLVMIFILPVISILSACQSADKHHNRERAESVEVTFVAARNINKNSEGEANPLRIMVYQLTQPQAFMSSDFITLTENSAPELSRQAQLLYDTIILPGEKKNQIFDLSDKVEQLGIITAYRDISDSLWKVNYILPVKPEPRWYHQLLRPFYREKAWLPHIIVRMDNLTTSVKTVN